MVTDKELAKQILRRDIFNLYKQMPQITHQLGINISPIVGIFEDKIVKYIDMSSDMIVDWLFGTDNNSDIDEVSDIAKMMANDKIEEYRKRVREAREKTNE